MERLPAIEEFAEQFQFGIVYGWSRLGSECLCCPIRYEHVGSLHIYGIARTVQPSAEYPCHATQTNDLCGYV